MKNLDLGFKNVGYRNHVMNGGMDISQREISFNSLANPFYCLDRWQGTYDGSSGTFNVSQNPFAASIDAQTQAMGIPTYYLNWNQSVAGSGDTLRVLRNFIEDVRTLAGKTVTLSFWAAEGSSKSIGVTIRQVFGSGGSADVEPTVQTVALSPAFTFYKLTFQMPSLVGKTIGSDHHLEVRFSLPINDTFGFALTNVMLNEGPDAAPFELQGGSVSDELRLCQRYYEKSFDPSTPTGTVTFTGAHGAGLPSITGGGDRVNGVEFKEIKRTTPTVTIMNPNNGATSQIYSVNDGGNKNVTSCVGVGSSGFAQVNAPGNSLNAGYSYIYQWSATADF